MKKIIIIGNTLSADIMYSYLQQDSRYEVVGFSVDKEYIKEKEKFQLPVIDLNQLKKVFQPDNYSVIIAVGYKKLNQVRQNLFYKLKDFGYKIETYIHEQANVFNHHNIGEGCIILSGTVIEPYVTIGNNTVIWANCVIGHHSAVKDNCWIASGSVLAGESKVQNNCFIGVNVTISNKIEVGEFNIIGGHTAIHKNTKNNEVYLSHHGEKHRFPALNYDEFFLK